MTGGVAMSVIEDGWMLCELASCFRCDFRDEAERLGVPMPKDIRLHIFDWGDWDGSLETHVSPPSSIVLDDAAPNGSMPEAVSALKRRRASKGDALGSDGDVVVPLDELEALVLSATEDLMECKIRIDLPWKGGKGVVPGYVCDFDFRPTDGYAAVGVSLPDAADLWL